jgi:hypothetical protein
MKKFSLYSATILAALTMSTGAHAAVDGIYGIDPVLDQQCSDLQRPSDNSGYTSFAENIQVTNDSSETIDTGILSTVGIGPATTTFTNFYGAHVNGQSVNIHAYGDKTVTYAGGALVTYSTQTTRTVTRSGKCHVHKVTEGQTQDDDPGHPGYQIAPRGLQTDEPVSATTVTVTTGTRTVTIPGPWIDPNASVIGGQVVICISPGRNPGAWRNQNGYMGNLGTCSRAWYDMLGSTPSVSVPAT